MRLSSSLSVQRTAPGRISFIHSGECEQGQEDSLESQIAVGAVKPLANGVGGTASTAGPDCGGLLAEREGNIGVSRSQARDRLDAQVCVNSTQHLEDVC